MRDEDHDVIENGEEAEPMVDDVVETPIVETKPMEYDIPAPAEEEPMEEEHVEAEPVKSVVELQTSPKMWGGPQKPNATTFTETMLPIILDQ